MDNLTDDEVKVKNKYLSLIKVRANLIVMLEEIVNKLEDNKKQLEEIEISFNLEKIEIEDHVIKNK